MVVLVVEELRLIFGYAAWPKFKRMFYDELNEMGRNKVDDMCALMMTLMDMLVGI